MSRTVIVFVWVRHADEGVEERGQLEVKGPTASRFPETSDENGIAAPVPLGLIVTLFNG